MKKQEPRLCSVSSCARKHKAHGYCSLHYRRVQNNGVASRPRDGGVCAVETCDRRCTRHLYCDKHYYRFRRHGDPLMFSARHAIKDTTKKEAFWAAIIINSENDCLEWAGAKTSWGYGRLSYKSKHYAAHRFAFELYVGPIPDGMFVCHHCDNPGCCNPNHLFLGTPKDNMIDMAAKGRHIGARKLVPEQVMEITDLLKKGVPRKEIAQQYSVGRTAIDGIANNKTWTHLGE